MKKQTTPTRQGYDMFEVSSLLQKAIRRQDAELAYFAANELIPHYRHYLWKRLLTVSAEDCYDLVTGEIISLREKDSLPANISRQYISKAVSILLNARKNRDADFFACNLFNSRDISNSLPKNNDLSLATKNGHSLFDVADFLCKSIDGNVDVSVGYAANELYWRYNKFYWKTLISYCNRIGFDKLTKEIVALRDADWTQKGVQNVSTIWAAKACTSILKVVRERTTDIFVEDFVFNKNINLSEYDDKRYRIPDYVYDCHTYIGKARKRTKEMFVRDEQAALRPLHKGDYDDVAWDRYFELCKIGFYVEDKITPSPSKERILELESGNVQGSLF